MTEVINVKVAHIRPKYHDLRAWMNDTENNMYIGRRGIVFIDGERFPKEDSVWCNPYKIGKDGTREEVNIKYRAHISEKIASMGMREELRTLRGKRLGCWCKPEPCHGDILLELANLVEL